MPNNVLAKQKHYQVGRFVNIYITLLQCLFRTRQYPSCGVDLGHHSTLVRIAHIYAILFSVLMFLGVYGAIFVAGMAATVFSMGEMVAVRTRGFSYERFKLIFIFTGQKS